MTRVTFDNNGFVQGFPYHDGFLDGVLADTKRADTYLALRAVTGEQRMLSLRSVKALNVSDFQQGNIVMDLRILPSAQAISDNEVMNKLEKLLFLTRTNLPPESLVFWLTSSYGAEVLAVCEDVEISEAGNTMTFSTQS